MRLSVIPVALFTCCSCATVEGPAYGERATFEPHGQSSAYSVSVAALLAQPTELEGKLLRIEGYLAADWEGPIIFFTREHCLVYSSFDGIAISMAAKLDVRWSAFQKPDCRRVVVEGIYKAYRYEPPDAGVISLFSIRNVLQNVSYIADIGEG